MIRKLINKLYIFIQWTKKWHFCHVLFISNFLFMTLYSLLIIFIAFIDIVLNNQFIEIFSIKTILLFYWFNCIMCFFVTMYTLPIALIVEIIIFCKNRIQHKNNLVISPFLTKNNKYNKLYMIAFLSNIACLVWCIWVILNNHLRNLF